MDDAWLKRLKLRPEGSAFAHYAHVLRLLSGLNDVGLIRAMVKAKKRQGEEARERELRTDPNVLAFQRFLEAVPPKDLPVVMAVISENLFPETKTGWFSAGSPDPIVSPSAAVEHVQTRAHCVVEYLSTLVSEMPPSPDHQWGDAVPQESGANEVVTTILSDDIRDLLKQPSGSSSGSSSVALPADDVFRVKVELVAAGYLISSEKFYLQKKVRAKTLMETIRTSFGKCLMEVEGHLFERLNNAVVSDDVILFEALPDVTKYEFQVNWSDLVPKNGREKLTGMFDVPAPLIRTQPGSQENGTVRITVMASNQVLFTQELSVPKKAKICDAAGMVISGAKGLFDELEHCAQHEETKEVHDTQSVVFGPGQGVQNLRFSVPLSDLIAKHGKAAVETLYPSLVLGKEPKQRQGVEPPCFLDITIMIEGAHTLCNRRFQAPDQEVDGTSDGLVECICTAFGDTLLHVKGYLTTASGERIPSGVIIADRYPDVHSFIFHVALLDLLMVVAPAVLKKTFPEAECFQRPEAFPEIDDILKKHTAIYGESKPVLTEVGVSESVPLQMKVPATDPKPPPVRRPPVSPPFGDTALAELVGDAVPASKTTPPSRPPSVESTSQGDAAPASKTKPASKPHGVQDVSHVGVLKVRLFLQQVQLMLRYEKVERPSEKVVGKITGEVPTPRMRGLHWRFWCATRNARKPRAQPSAY